MKAGVLVAVSQDTSTIRVAWRLTSNFFGTENILNRSIPMISSQQRLKKSSEACAIKQYMVVLKATVFVALCQPKPTLTFD